MKKVIVIVGVYAIALLGIFVAIQTVPSDVTKRGLIIMLGIMILLALSVAVIYIGPLFEKQLIRRLIRKQP